jgi:hypothetical protein
MRSVLQVRRDGVHQKERGLLPAEENAAGLVMDTTGNTGGGFALLWLQVGAFVLACNLAGYAPCWLGWSECPGAVVQSQDERNADDLEDGILREASRVRRPGV